MPSQPDVVIWGMNYPPELTGIAPYTGALAQGLERAGYAVVVGTAHPHYPEWKIREGHGQWSRTEILDGVEVRRLLHYVPRCPRGIRRLLSEVTFGFRLVFERWGRPKVVIAVSPSLFSTAIAALKLRVRLRRPALIVWVQDIYTLGLSETGEGGGIVRRLTRWVESRTLRAANRVVVIHPRFFEYVTRELGVSASRVSVVRNWTHLTPSEQVDSMQAKGRLRWPTNTTLAVHTGNMGAKQGLENVVDAARLADELRAPVHFVLVGDGGERSSLEKRARGVARISFVDPLSESEYRQALAAADVLVVNEKLGVAAMAVPSKLTSYFDAGRPLVAATDLRGITASEIEAAEAGIVVNAADPAGLLEAVLTVSRDSELAARLGSNGRRYRETVLNEAAAIESWTGLIIETCHIKGVG